MKETKNEEIERLNYENILWIIFIVGAILNILGDKLFEEFLLTGSSEKEKMAREIYNAVTILSILLYFYFTNRNYKFYLDAKESNENTNLEAIRFIGSVLLLVGASLILYAQVNSPLRGSPAWWKILLRKK